ncbi:MAG: hypothetical protein Q4Q23_06825 [Methanobacteriaceae archaeon]|nr:hypothetical protein [Methanobacteriaceae archaeon]
MTIRKNKITITKQEYRKFIEQILTQNKQNKKLPEEIKIKSCIIYKNEYLETIDKVNKFILLNGRPPETITIKEKRQRHKKIQ